MRHVRVRWAEPRSRFTMLMERLIIDLIQQCSTVTGACRIARVTWDEAWGASASPQPVNKGPAHLPGNSGEFSFVKNVPRCLCV